MFDRKCTIRNDNRDQNKVAQLDSIVIFPARDDNAFEMNASTQDC